MLTRELLQSNEVLSGLSEEQISAITTLSSNDENVVIGQRIGEVYRRFDETIATTTGVARDGAEKTYDYLARAAKIITDKANSVDALNSQIVSLKNEKERLEGEIAKGGDEATRLALETAKKDLASVRAQFTKLKTDFDKQKSAHESEIQGIRIDHEISSSRNALKLKQDIPASAADVLMSQAIAKVKGMNPQFIDDGKGGKVLAFHDTEGTLLRNPENKLEPFTALELLKAELKSMGILHEGKNTTGAGGNGGQGGQGGDPFDISGYKTQSEAHEGITQALLRKGLTYMSDEFVKKFDEIWEKGSVNKLPQ